MRLDATAILLVTSIAINVAGIVAGPWRLARWMGRVDAVLRELAGRVDRLPCQPAAVVCAQPIQVPQAFRNERSRG